MPAFTFKAGAEVRTGVTISPWDAGAEPADPPAAYFADLVAWVYRIDAVTGELAWRVKVDDHPNATVTGQPVLYGDRLYVTVSSLEVVPAADPSYPWLQLPRRAGRAGCRERRDAVESSYHHRGTGPGGRKLQRHAHTRAVGGAELEQPDSRPGQAAAVRRHRRELLVTRSGQQRCHHRLRHARGRHRLDSPNDLRRRVERGLHADHRGSGKLPGGKRTRRRFRLAADTCSARRGRGPGRRAEIG